MRTIGKSIAKIIDRSGFVFISRNDNHLTVKCTKCYSVYEYAIPSIYSGIKCQKCKEKKFNTRRDRVKYLYSIHKSYSEVARLMKLSPTTVSRIINLEKKDRWDEVKPLLDKGMLQKDIVKELNIAPKTIRFLCKKYSYYEDISSEERLKEELILKDIKDLLPYNDIMSKHKVSWSLVDRIIKKHKIPSRKTPQVGMVVSGNEIIDVNKSVITFKCSCGNAFTKKRGIKTPSRIKGCLQCRVGKKYDAIVNDIRKGMKLTWLREAYRVSQATVYEIKTQENL